MKSTHIEFNECRLTRMAMSSSRSGRRPGATQTRDAIAAAARAQFAEVGYERATMRTIAAAAGVDPALIVHFFTSKETLFREVTAVPAGLASTMRSLADGPHEDVGRRFAQAVVAMLEIPETRAVVLARIRSAASHPEAAELVRELVSHDIGLLTGALTDDAPDTRAALVGMQIVGLAFARYVVKVEPIASLPAPELVDVLAPTFQRLLAGPLAD
jgi:AcrR family transcriptional regulator